MTGDDGSRTVAVSIYVSEEKRDTLKAEANERGLSLSSYLLRSIDNQRRIEGQEELAQEVDPEARLAATVTELIEDIEDAGDEAAAAVDDAVDAAVEDRLERIERYAHTAGRFSASSWYLLKRDHPEGAVEDSRGSGYRAMRNALDDENDADADADADATGDDEDVAGSDSGSSFTEHVDNIRDGGDGR